MKKNSESFLRNNFAFWIAIIIISIVMTIYINKKEGFHEDEIFSYGSSNCQYGNMFQTYGDSDAEDYVVGKYIISNNIFKTIKNVIYYNINKKEFQEKIDETYIDYSPKWKTSEEAKEYVTVQKDNIFNYTRIYYNQAKDVHPPLFYYLVHTVSIFWINKFSKYIIFCINLLFFILTCYIIKKIFDTLEKKELILPTIILYGFSMGAISTVIFQRMYMMLTFFIILLLYLNLVFYKNKCNISKKLMVEFFITILMGFLTQYHFCIYAVSIAFVMCCILLSKKEYKKTLKYVMQYIISALVGIILFPYSINHIFFSYRGFGATSSTKTFIIKLKEFFSLLSYSFSLPKFILSSILLIILINAIYSIISIIKKMNIKMISENSKKFENLELNKFNFSNIIIAIPSIIFFILIVKTSPDMQYEYEIRYIMPILPIFSIVLITQIYSIIIRITQNSFDKKIVKVMLNSIIVSFTIILSIYGISSSNPKYLFKGYNKYLEIAEQYKDFKFIFVGETVFNKIQNIEEFMKYKESLIINTEQLEILKNNDGLKNESEVIISIKKYLNADETFDKIYNSIGGKSYEVLLDDNEDVACKIYKVNI